MNPRAAAAREQAFAEAYTRFHARVYARCRAILRDAAAAEDATQEVFAKAYERLDFASGPWAAWRWLFRTATNHALNELRAIRCRPIPVDELPEEAAPCWERTLDGRRLLQQLTSDVPDQLTRPAWLYFVHELNQEEIAKLSGVSRQTVIARLARFLAATRAPLHSELPPCSHEGSQNSQGESS